MSLRREAQLLSKGPESEPTFLARLAESFPTCTASLAVRPGTEELEGALTDYEARVEVLKSQLGSSSTRLSSQLEEAQKFETLLESVLGWLAGAEGQREGLAVCELGSSAIGDQLQNCQVSFRNCVLSPANVISASPIVLEYVLVHV